MKIISHRGGAKIAPENSIEAIRASKSLGVDAAEIDVQVTKDKQLVVFHDKNLIRLAAINNEIKNLTLKELSVIELKNGSKIVSLRELIKESKDLPLIIEGKGDGWGEILAHTLRPFGNKDRFKVISFNEIELNKFNKLSLSVDCYFLTIFNVKKAFEIVNKYNFKGIDFHFLAFRPSIYKKAQENNIDIILYTLNSKNIANLINHYAPNIAITTDRPDKFLYLTKLIAK